MSEFRSFEFLIFRMLCVARGGGRGWGLISVLKQTESEGGWIEVMVRRQHKKGRGLTTIPRQSQENKGFFP